MELADKCYECTDFGDMADGKSEYGYCHRVSDCSGGTYIVKKEQTRCIFGNANRKLSLEEIKTRDNVQAEKYRNVWERFKQVEKIFKSWPEWKQEILGRIS